MIAGEESLRCVDNLDLLVPVKRDPNTRARTGQARLILASTHKNTCLFGKYWLIELVR